MKTPNPNHPLTGRPKSPEHARKVAEAIRRRKANPELFAQCVERYKAGEPSELLAAVLNINRSTFIKWLRRAEIPTRTLGESVQARYGRMTPDQRQELSAAAHAAVRLDVDDSFIQRYRNGEDVKPLADEAGVHYETMLKWITEAGALRTQSEQGKRTWDRKSPADKARILATCRSRLGTKDPEWRRLQRAATREHRQTVIWPREAAFAEMLRLRGVATVHQKQCGPYNIDLASEISGVAIEVIGPWNAGLTQKNPLIGSCQAVPRHVRTQFLISQGWDVVEAWVATNRTGPSRAADAIATIIAQAIADPHRVRTHRVISSAGNRMHKYELTF